jgi:hypothetical protein
VTHREAIQRDSTSSAPLTATVGCEAASAALAVTSTPHRPLKSTTLWSLLSCFQATGLWWPAGVHCCGVGVPAWGSMATTTSLIVALECEYKVKEIMKSFICVVFVCLFCVEPFGFLFAIGEIKKTESPALLAP